MTIMRKSKSYVDVEKTPHEDVDIKNREERVLPLPPQIYHALADRRVEISTASTAHIVWDNDTCSMLLIGSRSTVDETAHVLSQFISGNRKLTRTETERHTDRQAEAAHLLLMSQLPPELSISSRTTAPASTDQGFSQFSGLPVYSASQSTLNRTVSDSQATKQVYVRRKLETEDSSYDSDHEYVAATRSTDSSAAQQKNKLSVSHDDISRCHSETLGQEFAEYVTSRGNHVDILPRRNSHAATSRDSSPTLSERLEGIGFRESPGLSERLESVREIPDQDIHSITQHPKYNTKVEFALKLGYRESLTQRALLRIGMSSSQNELLDELIRLHQLKSVDPKDLLLREAHEHLTSTLSTPLLDSFKQQQQQQLQDNLDGQLRPIVIDGSNVAMAHGNKEKFSCQGIQICVNYFQQRGHTDIKVFVPTWRKESSKPESPTTAQHILEKLEKERLLVFTPSRQVNGRRVVCLDDRYILQLAAENGGVVVSNDNFKDLFNEKPEFRKVIEERILMYSFANDRFMPPDDPLGRNGPTLDNFLKFASAVSDLPPPCPYEKKCTYGNKCKFYHAERGTVPHKSVTDRIKEQSIRKILEVRTRTASRDSSPGPDRARSINLVLQRTESDTSAFNRPKQNLARTKSSRPALSGSEDPYNKSEVSKSMSSDSGSRFRPNIRIPGGSSDWAGGGNNLELGCLNNYGLGGLIHSAPPPPGPWNTLVPPPADPVNSHRRLERQLTINPAFDPRINKPRFPKSPEILSTAAMEYMHRNPPPPLGVPPSDNTDFLHQNVTRIASAPDSIRQWGAAGSTSLPVAVVEPLGPLSPAAISPLQRSNSSSDTNLNRTVSADPFLTDSWKYKFESGISPILGSSGGQGSSIWGPLPSGGSTLTPPPSPGQAGLGPVGSRPVKETRLELKYHLSFLFPADQVERVMALLPEEQDPKKLCAAIMKMNPATTSA